MSTKFQYRSQVGDTSKIPWNGELKLPDLPPIDSVKTDTASCTHQRRCIERLAMRHFGFSVPESFEDLCRRAIFCGREYLTRDWRKENSREVHWINEVSYQILVGLLANREEEVALACDWMTDERTFFPSGPPFDIGNCFVLYRIANEFRSLPKLDEAKQLICLQEERSKQAKLLWDCIASIRENNQAEFLKQISEHLKLYGSAARKRATKAKLFMIEYDVSVFGSIVWAIARKKWPDLQELPVELSAFLLTPESAA